MAIESGRPFFIQESNTDTALPLDLSDEWLGRFAGRTDTTKALEDEVEIELSEKHATAIPYLVAMTRYSRVVGKAWELIYGVKAMPNQPVSHMIDYADTVLSNLLETLPEDLTYDPDLPKAQFDSRKRWQVKQTMLLSTVRYVLQSSILFWQFSLIFYRLLVCDLPTYSHSKAFRTRQGSHGPHER